VEFGDKRRRKSEQWLLGKKRAVEGIMGNIHKLTGQKQAAKFINFLPVFVCSLSTSFSTIKKLFSGLIPQLFP